MQLKRNVVFENLLIIVWTLSITVHREFIFTFDRHWCQAKGLFHIANKSNCNQKNNETHYWIEKKTLNDWTRSSYEKRKEFLIRIRFCFYVCYAKWICWYMYAHYIAHGWLTFSSYRGGSSNLKCCSRKDKYFVVFFVMVLQVMA